MTMTRSQIMNNGLLLVNQWHSRPEDFDESALVGLGNYFNWAVQVADASVSLFPVAADALKAAIDDAAAEDLSHYMVPEAYRSWDTQNSYFQKRVEKLSDKYSGDALIEGLKKLARENLSDLSPSPLLVKLEYSHPTLSQRIDAIKKLKEISS